MAFFNLTMMGYQNIYREFGRSKTEIGLPPINNNNNINNSNILSSGSTANKSKDSNLKYHELRHKHVRDQSGPTDKFQRPLTCAHEVGWWTRHDPVNRNLPWAFVERKAFSKSEMTSFADKMCLADKSFKMY